MTLTLEHRAGRTDRAQNLAQRAHDIAAEVGLRDYQGRALLALGEVKAGALFEDTDPGDGAQRNADGYFTRGLDLLREIGMQSELAKGLESYGRYKIEHGDTPGGKELLREALVLFSKLGMKRSRDVEELLASRK